MGPHVQKTRTTTVNHKKKFITLADLNASHIKIAQNLKEVFNFNVSNEINLILCSRNINEENFISLSNNFNNRALLELSYEQLKNFKISKLDKKAQAALQFITKDMGLIIKQTDLVPTLRIIPKHYGLGDAFTFHEDGGKWQILACYNKPATQGVLNNNAGPTLLSKITSFLPNDLFPKSPYYKPNNHADIFSFKPGDIWAQAGTDITENPFIHRAPRLKNKMPPRLLLVARKPKSILYPV